MFTTLRNLRWQYTDQPCESTEKCPWPVKWNHCSCLFLLLNMKRFNWCLTINNRPVALYKVNKISYQFVKALFLLIIKATLFVTIATHHGQNTLSLPFSTFTWQLSNSPTFPGFPVLCLSVYLLCPLDFDCFTAFIYSHLCLSLTT